ncbi:hypothetical protein MMC09_002013 [Bachmanniomyces sp. S44760]|nr:hypothetical protein [Bachmanniomyces sp. S44760]
MFREPEAAISVANNQSNGGKNSSSSLKMMNEAEVKEGIYASSVESTKGRMNQNDLGLTLLPGSQVYREGDLQSSSLLGAVNTECENCRAGNDGQNTQFHDELPEKGLAGKGTHKDVPVECRSGCPCALELSSRLDLPKGKYWQYPHGSGPDPRHESHSQHSSDVKGVVAVIGEGVRQDIGPTLSPMSVSPLIYNKELEMPHGSRNVSPAGFPFPSATPSPSSVYGSMARLHDKAPKVRVARFDYQSATLPAILKFRPPKDNVAKTGACESRHLPKRKRVIDAKWTKADCEAFGRMTRTFTLQGQRSEVQYSEAIANLDLETRPHLRGDIEKPRRSLVGKATGLAFKEQVKNIATGDSQASEITRQSAIKKSLAPYTNIRLETSSLPSSQVIRISSTNLSRNRSRPRAQSLPCIYQPIYASVMDYQLFQPQFGSEMQPAQNPSYAVQQPQQPFQMQPAQNPSYATQQSQQPFQMQPNQQMPVQPVKPNIHAYLRKFGVVVGRYVNVIEHKNDELTKRCDTLQNIVHTTMQQTSDLHEPCTENLVAKVEYYKSLYQDLEARMETEAAKIAEKVKVAATEKYEEAMVRQGQLVRLARRSCARVTELEHERNEWKQKAKEYMEKCISAPIPKVKKCSDVFEKVKEQQAAATALAQSQAHSTLMTPSPSQANDASPAAAQKGAPELTISALTKAAQNFVVNQTTPQSIDLTGEHQNSQNNTSSIGSTHQSSPMSRDCSNQTNATSISAFASSPLAVDSSSPDHNTVSNSKKREYSWLQGTKPTGPIRSGIEIAAGMEAAEAHKRFCQGLGSQAQSQPLDCIAPIPKVSKAGNAKTAPAQGRITSLGEKEGEKQRKKAERKQETFERQAAAKEKKRVETVLARKDKYKSADQVASTFSSFNDVAPVTQSFQTPAYNGFVFAPENDVFAFGNDPVLPQLTDDHHFDGTTQYTGAAPYFGTSQFVGASQYPDPTQSFDQANFIDPADLNLFSALSKELSTMNGQPTEPAQTFAGNSTTHLDRDESAVDPSLDALFFDSEPDKDMEKDMQDAFDAEYANMEGAGATE